MTRIITILFFFSLSLTIKAQTATPIVQGGTFYEFRNAVRVDSALFLPRKDTGTSNTSLLAPGMIVYRPGDSLLYYRKGNKMTALLGGYVDLSNYYTITQLQTPGSATVNYANLDAIPPSILLGRYSATSGSTQAISVGAGLTLNSGTGVLTGLSLNGQTSATQTFATGVTGTNFNISSSGNVHTFNLPDASGTVRGVVSTSTQTFAGDKTFNGNLHVGASLFLDAVGAGGPTDSILTIDMLTKEVRYSGGYYTKSQSNNLFVQNQSSAAQSSSSFWVSGVGKTSSFFVTENPFGETLTMGANSSPGAFPMISANGNLGFVTNSLERLRISSTGNVGIGTAVNPPEKFTVQGSVRLDLGSDSQGDILFRSSTGALNRLPIGTEGQYLTSSSGLPTWTSADAIYLTFRSKMTPLLTQPAVPIQPTDSLTQSLGKLQAQINALSGTYIENQKTASQTADMRISGDVQASGVGLFAGWYTSGLAGELAHIGVNAGTAHVLAFNRTSNAYFPLAVNGSTTVINGSSSGNIGLRNSSPTFNIDITGTTRIGGVNYKLFIDRTAVATQDNVIAFRSPGVTATDTIAYAGLASRSDNTFFLTARKSGIQIRVPADSLLSFSTHVDGIGISRKTVTLMRSGKWMWGDSILTAPLYPIHVTNAQDTSIFASHKIVSVGSISTGAISTPFLSSAITTSTALNETHHTVRVTTSGITLTFPAASTCPGREYYILNHSAGTISTSPSYINLAGASASVIAANAGFIFQSDGTNWYLVK